MIKRRMNHLFREDGKMLLVAFDHAAGADRPMPGTVHPGETIRQVVEGGADALLTTFGTATRFADELAGCGLILSVNHQEPMLEACVETALTIGADAIKCMVYPWLTTAPDLRIETQRLGADCHRWGMPLMVETIPGGWQAGPEFRTKEKIAGGARVGAECGADMLKTYYTGDPDSFRAVVDNVYVPVVILGGPKMENDRQLLEAVKGSIDGGGKGVAFGRNIFLHPHPGKIVAAIAAVLHDDATVDQAMKLLA